MAFWIFYHSAHSFLFAMTASLCRSWGIFQKDAGSPHCISQALWWSPRCADQAAAKWRSFFLWVAFTISYLRFALMSVLLASYISCLFFFFVICRLERHRYSSYFVLMVCTGRRVLQKSYCGLCCNKLQVSSCSVFREVFTSKDHLIPYWSVFLSRTIFKIFML